VFRHIHCGNRLKSDSASEAVESVPWWRTKSLTREASGQSASAATAVKPFVSMRRLVMAERAA
jgi:hypothetical protein